MRLFTRNTFMAAAAAIAVSLALPAGTAGAATGTGVLAPQTSSTLTTSEPMLMAQNAKKRRLRKRRANKRRAKRSRRRARRNRAHRNKRAHRRHRLRGHRGYRHRRRGYRRHSDGYWYPPAAFVFGSILGSAIANSGGGGDAHDDWCYDHYRSYRASDGTFQPYHGPRRRCNSPYDGI